MATMLNVYDRQTRKKTAVLQNAYNIIETHELNQIYTLSFSLPSTDEKNKYCLPRHFVRWGDDGELYRIKAPSVDESNVGTITYECEHVITTLCDSVMFGSFQYGGANVHTRATINWLLSQQKQQDWVLDVCEFDRKFEYLWEQENILNALYSIPKEFAQPYKWSFDTTVYPWKLSLRAIDETVKPEYYLRAKSNILASGSSADYANICTRIYPLGYGEGVNQLNIKDVNNGVAYIQSPQSIIAQYGIVEKVLVDRRFENAESLKAYAQTMLDLYQTPTMSRSFSVTDLYPLTNQSWDDAEVGKICRMTQDGTTAYITKCQWQRDKAGDLQIDLSTKATDIATSVADLADRVRIESVYAQGATQLYQHSKDANATPSKGMVMSLYFPAEMRQINKVLLRLKLNRFRSYSQTTESNGGYSQTLSVQQSSQEITSQTNTENSSVTVSISGGTATTMTPTTNQNLTTTSDGGGTGTTSTNGGGGVTVTPSVTVNVLQTENAYWDYGYSDIPTDKTKVGNDGLLKTADIAAQSTHYHLVRWRTAEVTPPASDNYKHYHSINFNTDLDYYGNQGYGGEHRHTVYDGGDGHSHVLGKDKLRHFHPVNVSASLNFSNEQSGYSGFAHSHTFSIGAHSHQLNIGHTHKVTLPDKTISVPCPKHKHNITLPGWSKTITIPPHTHGISAGIFESGNATAFDIYVNNTKKATVNSTSYDGDITTWLLNNKNQVPRDQWIDIEIRPNDLAYVVSSVFVQGFVQSRGGGNY